MNWLRRTGIRPRLVVLTLLWLLPVLFYGAAGIAALYQTGWFYWLLWTLPPIWTLAWLLGRWWPAAKLSETSDGAPLKAPEFWTPHDLAAVRIVEKFRSDVADVNGESIADTNRYLDDAKSLAELLAQHYHAADGKSLLHPLTIVEILSVVHLAVEDMEQWILENIPGSDLATVGQLERVPGWVNAADVAQKAFYFGSALFNPSKLLAYPLWRKSGRLTIELRDELIRRFYQRYLRQLGYYLIEMYSGRLSGGSRRYRSQFGRMADAIHQADGDLSVLQNLDDVSTTIAVMGQVKAGKSSLINALMNQDVAATSILPETREVRQFKYSLPGSSNSLLLLDTPGYNEADVTKQQHQEIAKAAKLADIIVLVMAANVPAKDADVQAVRSLLKQYESQKQLQPPKIIGVLTHIDRLRPVREWSPPYDWRTPDSAKEVSIAESVRYARELFGQSIAGYACVYTGEVHDSDTSVADELVPELLKYLDHGHSAAILKAFYQRLSQERIKQLTQQIIGLLRTLR
ncbi:dynamin family protein [Planctomycetes bacterium K23_9]|uniref:Putative GTP-binding protein EngB n=1 Tax=Stieleria marina TaxID=1930275 RepID=A0A517NYZ5_9BACT|nr:putative GTP-binding protein EngB [Planctomycetes bacterium K23_9]